MPINFNLYKLADMVEQITKGIKISVKTKFDGTTHRNNVLYFNFGYQITIENRSSMTVKLTDRFWRIFDSLEDLQFIEGEGVVGQTPVLKPNDQYTYKSFCLLASQTGAMNGHFKMLNTHTLEAFKVIIPTFQLTTPVLLN